MLCVLFGILKICMFVYSLVNGVYIINMLSVPRRKDSLQRLMDG